LNGRIFNLSGGQNCRIIYEDFLRKSFVIFGLNKFMLPKIAFAQRNFHCGYYEDSDELQNILNFRRENINDYFENRAIRINDILRFWAKILSPLYQKILVSKSEPLKAIKNFKVNELRRFFGNKISLE